MKYLKVSVISIFIITILIFGRENTSLENFQVRENSDTLILFFERIPGNTVIELRDFEKKKTFPHDKYRVYTFKVDSLYILGKLPFGFAPSNEYDYIQISKDSLHDIDHWSLERLRTMKKDSAHHFVMSFEKIFLIDAGYLENNKYTLLPVAYDDRIVE